MPQAKHYRLTHNEVNELLLKYIGSERPDRMAFNPNLSSYDGIEPRFGMRKHYGVLVLSFNALFRSMLKHKI